MYLNGFVQLEPADKIVGATCNVDGSPIIRFGALSVNLTWDELERVQGEIIRLQCAASAAKRSAELASEVLSHLGRVA